MIFLPKEIEMIIYNYEHQLKMRKVLDDILSLRECELCAQVHINENNCHVCGIYLCEDCIQDTNEENIICENCEEEQNIRQQDADELADYYDFMYNY